jgi:hypothetical protein
MITRFHDSTSFHVLRLLREHAVLEQYKMYVPDQVAPTDTRSCEENRCVGSKYSTMRIACNGFELPAHLANQLTLFILSIMLLTNTSSSQGL